jgi:RNA polymerase sigma-70 factor (ECF subfamily)
MYSPRVFREHRVVTPELLPEVLADHLDRLYRAAWALCGSREDAEDLVQETYTRVLAKKRTIASEEDALPYLLTVLRNTFRSSLRTRSRRPRTAALEDTDPRLAAPAGAGPDPVIEARAVFAAIAALPDDQRDVVAAVDVAGLSYAEAAETLGVPAGTIMSRLHRGRSRVAQAVG